MNFAKLALSLALIGLMTDASFAQDRRRGGGGTTGGGGGGNRYNPAPRPSPAPRPTSPSRSESRPMPERRPESRPMPERRPESRPAPERRPESRPMPERRPETRPMPDRRPETRPMPDRRPETRPMPDRRPETRPMPDRRPETRPMPDRRPETRPMPNRRPDRPTYRPQRPTTYRPVYRIPVRTHYGTRNYHRPPMYRHMPYSRYQHNPWRQVYVGPVRYARTWDYYSYVRRSYPNYVYVNWIWWPTTGYSNGYYVFNNYPYYVYNGYRYRYSTADYCNYQLVDSYTHQVQRNYWNQLCNIGFDQCSYERDRMNDASNDNRYFCAENYRDENYDYSRPTYDYTWTDYNNDGYDDLPAPPSTDYGTDPNYGNTDEGQDCYDYDYENDICYDQN